jgi:hypothetical protein
VDIGSSQAQFASACADLDALRCVGFLELGGNFLGAVGRAVVDDDELPVKVSGGESGVSIGIVGCGCRDSAATYCSVNVLFSSHVMMGRLRRSL